MAIDIRQAITEDEKERVFKFRYDIHVRELGKRGPGIDHTQEIIVDPGDDNATILYALDEDGAMVGTARSIVGADQALPNSLRETFVTAELERRLGSKRISSTGRLMVDPRYRGRTLASLLVMRLYQYLIARGTEVDFCMCALPLLRLYQHLGYRPYRDHIRPDGLNLRVPLVIALNDRAYLKSVRSPFSRLKGLPDDEGKAAEVLQAVYDHFEIAPSFTPGNVHTLWAELADGLSRSERSKPRLLDGFSEEETAFLFSRAIVHRFREGELVQLGAEEGRGLGVLLSGRLGVGVPAAGGYHWLELLSDGDVFGEPDAPPEEGWASDLLAIETCEVALLPEDIVERLQRKKPELAMRLARNLVAVLRHRVDDIHRLTSTMITRRRRTTEVCFSPHARAA